MAHQQQPSYPWTRLELSVEPSQESECILLGWSKYGVPYLQPHNALQTLDVHIPASHFTVTAGLTGVTTANPARVEPAVPNPGGIWIVYIHGGAWRDPKITSRSALPAVRRLFSEQRYASTLAHIAGIASINYSLSPHPNYPPGSIAGDAEDPEGVVGSRDAKHPRHILDVKAAINYLAAHYYMEKYIIAGHSCGATLAFHAIMPQASRTTTPTDDFPLPAAIAGVAGLYDLPTLVHAPGEVYEPIAPIYRSFLMGAFGSDEDVWTQLSPASTCDPATTWPAGKAVLLSASKDDTLVPYAQLETMHSHLAQHWMGRSLLIAHFSGDHNDAWEHGVGVADAVAKLVTALNT